MSEFKYVKLDDRVRIAFTNSFDSIIDLVPTGWYVIENTKRLVCT